jgi:hypothetical protein
MLGWAMDVDWNRVVLAVQLTTITVLLTDANSRTMVTIWN